MNNTISDIPDYIAKKYYLNRESKYAYKYRTLDENGYTERLLTEGEIHFSRADLFNDSFDCNQPFYTLSKTHAYEISRAVKRGRAKTYILSLSLIEDSIPMWTYYASNYSGPSSGLCVEIQLQYDESLKTMILPIRDDEARFIKTNNLKLPVFKVNYTKKPNDPINVNDAYNYELCQFHSFRISMTKPIQLSHEREIRCLLGCNDIIPEEGNLHLRQGTITKIFLNPGFDSVNFPQIAKSTKDKDSVSFKAKIYCMIPCLKAYELAPVLIPEEMVKSEKLIMPDLIRNYPNRKFKITHQ